MPKTHKQMLREWAERQRRRRERKEKVEAEHKAAEGSEEAEAEAEAEEKSVVKVKEAWEENDEEIKEPEEDLEPQLPGQ